MQSVVAYLRMGIWKLRGIRKCCEIHGWGNHFLHKKWHSRESIEVCVCVLILQI